MKINKILINNLEKPFGFSFSNVNINIKFEETKNIEQYTIEMYQNGTVIYKQENIAVDNTTVTTGVSTEARSEYRVIISAKNEIIGETEFESGYGNKSLQADWIAGRQDVQNNVFSKQFSVDKPVAKARLYASSQGVYEVYIDGKKIGDEVLAPGFTNYNKYTQLQTYDVTELITNEHILQLSVGDGWFKGTLGFGEGTAKVYGDVQAIISELHIAYSDGSSEVINSDLSWSVSSGSTTASAIYYGQDIDLSLENFETYSPTLIAGQPLIDRLSVPIKVMEEIKPVKLITTPAGEQVIDFGQNHSGWVKFLNTAPQGQKIVFEFGEILQESNFYRGNLREARARFEVISDGEERYIHPTFTFFGYRYLKVEGIDQINLDNYVSQVIYSDIDFDTYLKSDNQKVNRLFENINWGQKSNFIDVPTDCPQRNERLGWTGDANIFGKTAMLSSNVVQFYKKYLKDVRVEQEELSGMIPMYAPAIGHKDGGAAVWSDVITMLPWSIYEMTGDTEVLTDNYQAMKSWLNWVGEQTKNLNNKYIWTGSFQFGDWLALDGSNPSIPSGGTDENFIATIYYYLSTDIAAKTAETLGYQEEKIVYSELASNIKQAILDEYITASGKLTLNTQTGYALMLESGILSEKQLKRVIDDLIFRLNCDSNLIQTGFVGTPLLCPALSKNGYHNLATQILLNEESPSWLYAVNMGATTIWERWNSVQEDGSMNPDGMNSLNHYAYGAIKAWAIEYLLGIQNTGVAYDTVTINPGINSHIRQMAGSVRTNGGYLTLDWQLTGNKVLVNLEVPVGTTVNLQLSGLVVDADHISDVDIQTPLEAGSYKFEYSVDVQLIQTRHLTLESSLFDLSNNKDVWSQLLEVKPQLGFFRDKSARAKFGNNTLAKIAQNLPFITFSDNDYRQIEAILNK